MTAESGTRLLIVEPRERGHLLVYVRLIALRALRRGFRVTVALSPDAPRTREFATHLSDLLPSITLVSAPAVLTPRSVSELSRWVPSDVVVIPHGDELAARAGSLVWGGLKTPTRLLIMRDPRWDRVAGVRTPLRNHAKWLLLRSAMLRRNTKLVWLRGPAHRGASGVDSAIDPFIAGTTIEEIQSRGARLRHRFDHDDRTFWFGVTGAVSRRKNLDLVVTALVALHERRPDVPLGLAVIGPIDHDVLSVFNDSSARLSAAGVGSYFDDRLLANDEMNDVVAAVDAVVMAYSTNAPNSTLGKAFVLGTKIVSAGSPTFRAHAEHLDGLTSALDPASLSFAMEAAVGQPPRMPNPTALTADSFADAVLGAENADETSAP